MILFRDNLGESVEEAQELARELRSLAPPGFPLVLLADEEGGLISQTTGLRQSKGRRWAAVPTPRALGRLGRPVVARQTGQILGRRLRTLGFQVDLAPCLDLDAERENPVIGSRAFGLDPSLVADYGRAFAQGLSEAGITACFKHFPGHGGTRLDSHACLPTMDPAARAMHERPFREALYSASGKTTRGERPIAGPPPWVMSAHIDWGDGIPASLSREKLQRLQRWSPRSLVITDSLDMASVAVEGGAAKRALLAGNDLLLEARDWKAGLAAMAMLEASGEADPAVGQAMKRARRRVSQVWREFERFPVPKTRQEGRAGTRAAGASAGEAGPEREILRRLHRLPVRLDHPSSVLPRGGWLWIVPAGMAPYTRLREWVPPKGRRRFCQEVCWVPEMATPSWLAGLARRLEGENRPILVATLFRGRPGDGLREAWSRLLALPPVRVAAHLCDEIWPLAEDLVPGGAIRSAIASATGRPAVAFTSGPSAEALTGLAEALDLPESGWSLGTDGLYFPVDS